MIKLIGQRGSSKCTCSKLHTEIQGYESECYKDSRRTLDQHRNNYVEKNLKLNEHSSMRPN